MKPSKSYYTIFLCLIISIIICSSGYQFLNVTQDDSNKKTKILAKVIEVRYINDGNYELTVVYFIKRTKYTSSLITKNKKKVGDEIDIYYNDDDPTIITEKSNKSMFYLGNTIICCGCCIFIFVLISLFSKPKKEIVECEKKSTNNVQQSMNFPYFIPYIPVMNK